MPVITELSKTYRYYSYPRIILGHRSAVITEVYAEQDKQKALEAIVRVG